MRIAIIADGRSAIARNWISYLVQGKADVHLISSYPFQPLDGLVSWAVLPLAFGEVAGSGGGAGVSLNKAWLRRLIPVSARTWIRQWLGSLTLPRAARKLRTILADLQPDLIHAMRIPYEGMLAAMATAGQSTPPLLVSVWGNDFTLHAGANPLMGYLSRRTMQRVQALHTDCQRDLRLAIRWGFSENKPHIVLPGGGGVRLDIFYPPPERETAVIPVEPVVINPRGIREYVRNDTFFQAARLVLDKNPATRFICLAMAGEAQAERWVAEFDLAERVSLLPPMASSSVAAAFRSAHVAVSPSTHDGTPNTLLEAMACGCFPIAGDIESLREWIVPGVNGLLIDPGDPAALAEAILSALSDSVLRQQAQLKNQALIKERAESQRVMAQAEAFYRLVTG